MLFRSLEARAAADFLHGLAVWDFAQASRASALLVAAAERGELWLAPDLLRDGAVTAQLMLGNATAARDIFVALAPLSQRESSDLRTMVLEAMIRERLTQPSSP